jgi:hypothetical protein
MGWIGGLLALMMILVATIIVVALLVLDVPTRQNILSKLFGVQPIPEDAASWQSPGGKELTWGAGVHYVIAAPIAKCFKIDIMKSTLPVTVAGTLLLGLQPNGSEIWSGRGFDEQKKDPETSIDLNNYQLNIILLSDAIERARMQTAESAASNRSRMELYQWVLIGIGAITTILISIKSILPASARGFVTVGILAIIFSAFGTACSSIVSFYGPSEAFARSDRALGQLRQLHADLSFAVANSTDLCTPTKDEADPRAKIIKDFSTRFGEIVTTPGTSSAQNPTTKGETGPR